MAASLRSIVRFSLLRVSPGRTYRNHFTGIRPAVLALTVAAALTLLNPSMHGPRLDRGQLQPE
jgi:hypothetical protein